MPRGAAFCVCVENMPPGVHPGQPDGGPVRPARELDRPGLALALDTGHAHISADLPPKPWPRAACWRTTHVHDNDGRHDTHDCPGHGTIDWAGWATALDRVGYRGAGHAGMHPAASRGSRAASAPRCSPS